MSERPHVVVVGGGFAGLAAVRGLAGAAVDVTLIDRSNHHLFQPLLYQVATAGLSAPDIAAPLRHILRSQQNVSVLMGEVDAIDTAARSVRVGGREIGYDYLLVASGATHAYFGREEWAAHAPGLKTLDDALHMRRRVLLAFERAEAETDPALRAKWLRFVVIGAGPTGVELAGTLAEIARHTLRREFRNIDPAEAEVHLVEAGPAVLGGFGDALAGKARRQLEHLGVRVHTGAPVTAIDANGLSIGQAHMDARTVLWAAGVAASPLGRMLGAPLDRAARVQVAPDLSLAAHPEVFVAGDLAAFEQNGKQLPGVAPVAKQMGAHVARCIRARVAAAGSPAFRYKDPGSLATIGRMAAVARFGRIELSGLLAWWAWLFIHIFFLIGFRNRAIVLINWAWAYWTFQRHARIVIGPADRSDAAPATRNEATAD